MNLSDHKFEIQLIAAVVVLTVGCGLLIAGFSTEPVGEIHNSVLIAFGEILTWTGAVLGMKTYYSASIEVLKHKLNHSNKEANKEDVK